MAGGYDFAMKQERPYVLWLAVSVIAGMLLVGVASLSDNTEAAPVRLTSDMPMKMPMGASLDPSKNCTTRDGGKEVPGSVYTTPDGSELCLNAPPIVSGAVANSKIQPVNFTQAPNDRPCQALLEV